MTQQHMGVTEWLLLITLSILWGGSFFFAEIALLELSTFQIVFLRVVIAAAALWLYVYLRGDRMPSSWGIWIALFIMGLLNNAIPFSLIVWGQVYIDSGLASILNATTPLFTVVLANWLTSDEKLGRHKMIGVLIGLAGVAFLIGPAALQGFDLQGIGQIAILGAALSYAFASIFGKRLSQLPTHVAAAGMLTGSTVWLAVVIVLFDTFPFFAMSTNTLGAILGIALLSSSLAYLIYFRILAKAGATNLMLVTFLIPVSALILGIGLLGESLSANALIGMLLIFAGLAAVDGRVFALFRKKPA